MSTRQPGPDRRPLRWIAALAVGALIGFHFIRSTQVSQPSESVRADTRQIDPTPVDPAIPEDLATLSLTGLEELAATLRARLTTRGARPDEAVLIFKNETAYRRFLARAATAGVAVLGRIDGLLAVRVRTGDYDALARELVAHAGDYTRLGPNPLLGAAPPVVEERAARLHVPVGDGLLAALGLDASDSTWGRGVLVAVLDGGASPDAPLGNRLKYLDIGYGVSGAAEDGRHGTAVASLVAGSAAGALGVAPAAEVLSIRVTDGSGLSDAFSVAQGLVAAIEAGAKVVNISLGGPASSPVLAEAIEFALARDVAVVAAAGNDQAASLAWPAAYAGVVSVGAVDAAGQQAIFSNSGDSLQLTAPGYAIQTAGLAGERIAFTGTSASAPVAAGAIAVLLSVDPTLSPIAAADLLASYANEAGPLGEDPDYGRGTINLGSVLGRNDATRRDPALASLSYVATKSALDVVIQNRGSRAESGLGLTVTIGSAAARSYTVPDLAAGQAVVLSVPVPVGSAGTSALAVARLVLPSGLSDRNTSNNRLAVGVVY